MKRVLDPLASIAFIAVCAVFLWKNLSPSASAERAPRPPVPIPTQALVLDNLQLKGNRHAPIGIVEFSDFECPFCRQLEQETMSQVDKEFVQSGQVLVAYSQMPLPIHASAFQAAEASECAGEQGKFWELHDFIFETPDHLKADALMARSDVLGLDATRFRDCVSSHKTKAGIDASMQLARALHVASTPTLMIGSVLSDGHIKVAQVAAGFQTIDNLRAVIRKLLKG